MPPIPRTLRRHPLIVITTVLAGTSGVLDHRFGRPADDWSRYDHQRFGATVLAGDALRLDDGTPVRLLGVTDPAPSAAGYLARELSDRQITLLLPMTGTRGATGTLAAYAFTADDHACLNVAIVRDGMAHADRRALDPMAGAIDAAENNARRRRRGLWDGKQLDPVPPWRQASVRARSATRP